MAASASTSAARLLSMQQVSCEACTVMLAQRLHRRACDTISRHMRRGSSGVVPTNLSFRQVAFASNAIALSSNSNAATSRHTRHFHSSRRAGFALFGYKKKSEDIEAVAQAFQEALYNEDAEKVTQAYTSLRQTLLANPTLQASDYTSIKDVSRAMRLLSRTSYINEDFRAVCRMKQDLRTLWRQAAPSAEAYSAYIAALLTSGRLEEALRALLDAASSQDSSTSMQPTSSQDWNLYLVAVSNSRGKAYSAVKTAFDTIPSSHRDARTYMTLLEALLTDPTVDHSRVDVQHEVQDLLDHIDGLATSVEQQVERHTALLNGQNKMFASGKAASTYKELDALATGKLLSVEASIALIRYEISQMKLGKTDNGSIRRRSAMLAEASSNARRSLTAAVLKDITGLQTDWSLQQLRQALSEVEAITGILPDYTAYEHAMHCCQGLEDALALLRDSHRDGVSLSSGMLRAIVSKLSSDGVDADTQETIKSIYGDLGRSRLSDERSRDGIHDVSLYIALLRYCARNDISDLSWAITLMEDLKAHGLSILNSEEATKEEFRQDQSHAITSSTPAASIVTSLMENASQDHSQAFKAYAWMWAIDPDNIFSKEDWYDIIRTYANLTFPGLSRNQKKSYVPSSVFFAFFEDMRKSGVPPDSPVYQAVLQYYAREGGSAKSSAEAIRLVHNLIKMDHYHDPDIELMNTLMHAYSQTGILESAIGVWRSILINKIPFNNETVSIILDVYGQLGEFGKAAKLWESLKIRQANEQVYEIDKKNLQRFIEAACRTGNNAKAIEECFAALQWKEGALVDEKMLETLFNSTKADSQASYTLGERIRKEAPQYWAVFQKLALSQPVMDDSSASQPKTTFNFSSLANRTRETSESASESASSDIQLQKP